MTPKEIKDGVLLIAAKAIISKSAPQASKLFRKEWNEAVDAIRGIRFKGDVTPAHTFASSLSDLVMELVGRLAEAENAETVAKVMAYLRDLAEGNVAVMTDTPESSLAIFQITEGMEFPGGDDVYVWNKAWYHVKNNEQWLDQLHPPFFEGATHWTRLPSPQL